MSRAFLFTLLLTSPLTAQTLGKVEILALPTACDGVGRLDTRVIPNLGFPLLLEATWGHAPQVGPQGLVSFDLGGPAWNGGPIPQPLGAVHPDLSACLQLAAADVVAPMFLRCGMVDQCSPLSPPCPVPVCSGVWSQFIPFDQSIVGLTLRAQALMVDATAQGQLILRVTNGLRITIGG